jgi:hypothetical protein
MGDKHANALEWELNHLRKIKAPQAAEELRESWFCRMWNVSAFMKVLKQRFTQWFNGRHQRKGTLWEDRFRSVLVEGEWRALQTMAAYIDLNPVRAHLCDDPKDYRWCGYAEAVAGGKQAREALQWLVGLANLRVKAEEPVKAKRGKSPSNEASTRFAVSQATHASTASERDEKHQAIETQQASGPEMIAEMGQPWNAARPMRAARVEMMEALRVWRCELFGLPWNERAQAAERAKGPDGVDIFKKRLPREKALEVLAAGGR